MHTIAHEYSVLTAVQAFIFTQMAAKTTPDVAALATHNIKSCLSNLFTALK